MSAQERGRFTADYCVWAISLDFVRKNAGLTCLSSETTWLPFWAQSGRSGILSFSHYSDHSIHSMGRIHMQKMVRDTIHEEGVSSHWLFFHVFFEMSKPAFQPLSNLGGSNFCFINSIIQVGVVDLQSYP